MNSINKQNDEYTTHFQFFLKFGFKNRYNLINVEYIDLYSNQIFINSYSDHKENFIRERMAHYGFHHTIS